MKSTCWKEWAEANGWCHIGWYKGKPLLCKIPGHLFSRISMNMGVAP